MGKENQNLSSLKGADKLRLRAGVMLGSDDIKGVQQTTFEILSNSIDRFKAGFGNVIKVTKHKDLSYTIQDFADGLPMAWNEEEGCYNWELALCTLYAGSNYSVATDDHNGQLGLNGLGLTSTQQTSEWMKVISKKKDFIYKTNFVKGRPVDYETNDYLKDDDDIKHSKELGAKVLHIENNNTDETGTCIHYKPDLEVFTDIDIPLEWFDETLNRQAMVNKGLKIIFYNEATETDKELFYENGIVDSLKERTDAKSISDILTIQSEKIGKDDKDKPEYKVSFEIAFRFSNEVNFLEYYHNSSFLEYGGSPDKAVKNAFVYSFDSYMKDNGLYNKGEKKITFVDIQDSLALIVNSYSSRTSYENQTKKAITNKFIQEAMQDAIKDFLNSYFKENPKESELLVKQILANKRSREKAERTRINVRKQLTGSIDISNRVKKFVDCRTKDKTKRELFIVEGDSAKGSCQTGRNAEFQAIMPVRGKILNCLKADYDKIFKSDIIVDLLKVLGCGVQITSKHNKDLNTFDIEKLRWNKIILCTDQDVDGFQIRTLILTMLYILCPTVIQKGFVYIVESPLYEITNKKQTYFAYTDKEKNNLISNLEGKVKIQRSKGLGENDPDMMWNTTMNPETRKLIKVTMKDCEDCKEIFDLWLGDDPIKRREELSSKNINNFMEVLDVQ